MSFTVIPAVTLYLKYTSVYLCIRVNIMDFLCMCISVQDFTVTSTLFLLLRIIFNSFPGALGRASPYRSMTEVCTEVNTLQI